MAKDWRLAVCTRWRTLATIILVCLSLLCIATFADSVFTEVDEYPIRQLAKRIERIKVGMTVAELESILGPPDSRTEEVERENLNLVEGGSDKIVEYRYSVRSWLVESLDSFGGIFVDENTARSFQSIFQEGG
jgi:hypothetical protein